MVCFGSVQSGKIQSAKPGGDIHRRRGRVTKYGDGADPGGNVRLSLAFFLMTTGNRGARWFHPFTMPPRHPGPIELFVRRTMSKEDQTGNGRQGLVSRITLYAALIKGVLMILKG